MKNLTLHDKVSSVNCLKKQNIVQYDSHRRFGNHTVTNCTNIRDRTCDFTILAAFYEFNIFQH